MYHVYLRDAEGRLMGNVSHPETREAAERAFSALIERREYDDFGVVAVLAENKRPIAVHRFDAPPGDAHNWRGRLQQLPFSTLH
jgi:hypothetical protein